MLLIFSKVHGNVAKLFDLDIIIFYFRAWTGFLMKLCFLHLDITDIIILVLEKPFLSFIPDDNFVLSINTKVLIIFFYLGKIWVFFFICSKNELSYLVILPIFSDILIPSKDIVIFLFWVKIKNSNGNQIYYCCLIMETVVMVITLFC